MSEELQLTYLQAHTRKEIVRLLSLHGKKGTWETLGWTPYQLEQYLRNYQVQTEEWLRAHHNTRRTLHFPKPSTNSRTTSASHEQL